MDGRVILSNVEILSLVDPADPDNLIHEGNGVYVARWLVLSDNGESSPFSDAWIIAETPGVEVIEELHETYIGEALVHCREMRFAMSADYLKLRKEAGWDLPDNEGQNPMALS